MLRPTWIFIDCIRKQTHQCAHNELKIVNKTWQQKHLGKYVLFFVKKVKFLGSHTAVLVKTFPLMYQLQL